MSYKYFPPTSIHIAVVDPGVGSRRRPLLVVTEDHYFIGPDNGIFTPIFEELKSTFFKVFHVTASHYFRPMSGSTFHGRDIFAPVAAWLSKDIDSQKLGDQIDDYTKISYPRPVAENNTIIGEVVSIDCFGNAISNIKKDDLTKLIPRGSKVKFKVMYNNEHLPFVNYYAENKNSGLAALINSFGHIELFVYQNSAAGKFNIKIGDSVTIHSA
jgi:hypothetical protein